MGSLFPVKRSDHKYFNYCISFKLFMSMPKFKPSLVPDENIATSQHGAEVIEGEMRESLLDGDTTNFDLDRGFTRHLILEGDKGICIALGRPSIINNIKMLLWNKDPRSYSYYIEVSVDNEDWIRVIDYSKYFCRSWQRLYFKPRVVRQVVKSWVLTKPKPFDCDDE